MNDFAADLTEDRRLTILRVLLESTQYTANEFIVQTMLKNFAHMVSVDRLHTDLAWLQEQELITVRVTANVRIATLTVRGADVAQGLTVVPGVKRPRIG